MSDQPTSRDTKAEILKMYDQLLQEKGQLEAKVEQLTKEKQAAPKERSKVGGQVPSTGRLPVPSTLDGIIETLSELRPGFGDAVSELSAQLIAEASKLADLRQEVEKEVQQLEALHGLEVTADTLDQLIQEYIEKSGAFDTEARKRREAFEQEMREKWKAWQKEQEEHARSIKERDETTRKAGQREAAEYKYDLELRQRLDNDAYEQEQENLKKALENFEEAKKKEWAERENRIAEQEKEFAELKTRVEKFPKELESAIEKAQEEGTETTRRQAKVKADLREKEVDGERRVYELKAQSLEAVIKNQLQQIKSLSTQLDAAIRQVQDLAVKAIEGSSSAGSLQAVKEIALEQAKNVQKGK